MSVGRKIMNDSFEKMGPHDLGGDDAGPIDFQDHGMKHWEKQSNALRMTVTKKGFSALIRPTTRYSKSFHGAQHFVSVP